VFCWMLCRYVHCICTCVLFTVYMYVYIHCVLNIHSTASCLLHFDVANELRLFVCIGITWVGGGRSGVKCPFSISLPNNNLVSQECVYLACEWANCMYLCSALVQKNGRRFSDLASS
jgi:hypothetical protein